MAAMTGDGYSGDGSPDRADALVWALSELMVSGAQPAQPVFGTYGRNVPSNQFGYIPGGDDSGAGAVFASMPPEYWAERGIFHPSDRQMWIDKGVYNRSIRRSTSTIYGDCGSVKR